MGQYLPTAMAANGLSFLPDSSLPLQQDFSTVFSLLQILFLNTYYTGHLPGLSLLSPSQCMGQ
jgi:hypothetical protein